MSNKPYIILAALAAFALAGCGEKGPAEQAGEKTDSAVEQAQDAAKQAGEKAADAVNGAAQKAEEVVDKAVEGGKGANE